MQTIQVIQCDYTMFMKARERNIIQRDALSTVQQDCTWSPLFSQMVKINVDASWNRGIQKVLWVLSCETQGKDV